jgi:hypothetical protein
MVRGDQGRADPGSAQVPALDLQAAPNKSKNYKVTRATWLLQ